MTNPKSKTSIIIEKSTRELLGQVGRKNQTYDQLIHELVKKSGLEIEGAVIAAQ